MPKLINAVPGSFAKSMITNIPANLKSKEAKFYKKNLKHFPEEAVYIYSFKENKMIYAHGWEEILGYPDNTVSMLTIVSITSPDYMAFSNELNDKALKFILEERENLEEYSFTIELKKLHQSGAEIPLISRVSVHKSENGMVTEIIGRSQINRSINLGKVMRYAAYGPSKSKFEEQLNRDLFKYFAISDKEKEALKLFAEGFTFKDISKKFDVSESAIQKRILPLYKRFDVKNLPHLISFAFQNHILP